MVRDHNANGLSSISMWGDKSSALAWGTIALALLVGLKNAAFWALARGTMALAAPRSILQSLQLHEPSITSTNRSIAFPIASMSSGFAS